MPRRLKLRLWATARRRGYGPARSRRYVYGTLHKLKRRRRRRRG